jgi:hypothetical protein
MRKTVLFLLYILVAVGIASCSYPGRFVTVPENPDVMMQYRTVSGMLTQTHVAYLTVTPSPDEIQATQQSALTLPAAATELPGARTLTPAPVGNETAAGRCDLAQAGRPIDITIPDDTRLIPGQYFSKTWRLVNAGTCTWNSDYAVVWFSGSDMGVIRSQSFNSQVLPGNSVDVTVEMIAPMSPGTYQSNWKLRNNQGQHFGIGPNGDAPFWVRIVVIAIDTPTVTPQPPTLTPTPAIIASGSPAMKLDESLDLDTGQFNQLENDDLVFVLDEDQPHLNPENGARLVHFGTSMPGIEDCLLSPVAEAPIPLDALQAGSYLCYRTTQGLPGRIYLSSIDMENNLLNLEFVTWALP